MGFKKIISFNIITTAIIYIIACILLFIINPILSYIFLGISLIHIIYFYLIVNKLKKLNNEESFKQSN